MDKSMQRQQLKNEINYNSNIYIYVYIIKKYIFGK